MSFLKPRHKLFVSLVSLIPVAVSAADMSVLGRWASDGSILELTEANGSLSARIIALDAPNYTPEEEGDGIVAGTPRLDHQNPDPSLQARPVLGLELLDDYEYDGKRWQGKIYDPESGNTYSSRMTVDDEGNLSMRGYVGMPMFGRTATFTPVARCEPHVTEMLKLAELKGCEQPQ